MCACSPHLVPCLLLLLPWRNIVVSEMLSHCEMRDSERGHVYGPKWGYDPMLEPKVSMSNESNFDGSSVIQSLLRDPYPPLPTFFSLPLPWSISPGRGIISPFPMNPLSTQGDTMCACLPILYHICLCCFPKEMFFCLKWFRNVDGRF